MDAINSKHLRDLRDEQVANNVNVIMMDHIVDSIVICRNMVTVFVTVIIKFARCTTGAKKNYSLLLLSSSLSNPISSRISVKEYRN